MAAEGTNQRGRLRACIKRVAMLLMVITLPFFSATALSCYGGTGTLNDVGGEKRIRTASAL
jgi:hypothetical protein